jgi:HK97 family phage prohead protease
MKRKMIQLDSCRLKFDDEARTIEGYASVFEGVDSYGDTVRRGAYEETLRDRERPVRMRWNHWGPVIGKWTEIREDEKGLYVRGELTPGHSVADNVYASLKHGAIDGLSIGYIVEIGDGAEKNETGGYDLTKIDLIEISVVEEPADLGANISNVKTTASEIEQIETLKQVERLLMEGGFSKAVAVALIGRIKSLASGDPEPEKHVGDPMQGLNWRMFRALNMNGEKLTIK